MTEILISYKKPSQKISIHYFESESGKVFDVDVKKHGVINNDKKHNQIKEK